MDVEQEFAVETQHIKVEVLEVEDNPLFNQLEVHQLNTKKDIKRERGDLESCITKYEVDDNKDDSKDGFIINDHNEPLQSVDITKQKANIKPRKCNHPNCGKSFKTNYELNEHVVIHSDVKPFQCEGKGCKKTFKRRKDLKAHMEVHNEYKPYNCKYKGCSKTFRTSGSWRKHNNCHHNKKPNKEVQNIQKLFICEHNNCGKNFKTIYLLRNHALVHSDDKPFVCEEEGCRKAFKRNYELEVHMTVHREDKPFRCSFDGCGKSYKARYNLTRHIRLHSGHTTFKCSHENCDKLFKRKADLKTHQNVHSSRIIACDYPDCEATFRWNRSYNAHMQKHKFARRYSCSYDQCKSVFYRRGSLRRHIKEVHKPTYMETLKSEDSSSNDSDGLLKEVKYSDKEEMAQELGVKGGSELEIQCPSCERIFSEGMEFQEHVEYCGKYSKFEFVGVDQMESDNVIVDVESKLENI